jgi:hypothetical protein
MRVAEVIFWTARLQLAAPASAPTHLSEVERRGLASVVVVPVHVKHLQSRQNGVVSCRLTFLPLASTVEEQCGLTFLPATDSRPDKIHSFRPVPSTIASYCWSMARVRLKVYMMPL